MDDMVALVLQTLPLGFPALNPGCLASLDGLGLLRLRNVPMVRLENAQKVRLVHLLNQTIANHNRGVDPTTKVRAF